MTLKETVESALKAYLYRLASEYRWNITKMCREAKISRQSMYRYLCRVGVNGKTGSKKPWGGKWGRPTVRIGTGT